jgi:tRNA modification GTPase
MDLAQCEAVADLIDAGTALAARSASRSLQGVFSRAIAELSSAMIALRVYVEAAIDFPEEEVDFLSEGNVLEKIEALLAQIRHLQKEAKVGQILREGLSVVISGAPNAGKSSLLNCLTRHETAIVTAIAGTTRDLIKETIQIDGFPLHVIDTAGIRNHADVVEMEGIKRAKEQQQLADRILLIVDASQNDLTEAETTILREHSHKTTIIMNKIDLAQIPPGLRDNKIYLSAKTGQGRDFLLAHLKECMGVMGVEAGNFTARRRHLEALQKTRFHCESAHTQLVKFKAAELVAQELRTAHEALGEIVGTVSSDDMLGKIFASFCIGK